MDALQFVPSSIKGLILLFTSSSRILRQKDRDKRPNRERKFGRWEGNLVIAVAARIEEDLLLPVFLRVQYVVAVPIQRRNTYQQGEKGRHDGVLLGEGLPFSAKLHGTHGGGRGSYELLFFSLVFGVFDCSELVHSSE